MELRSWLRTVPLLSLIPGVHQANSVAVAPSVWPDTEGGEGREGGAGPTVEEGAVHRLDPSQGPTEGKSSAEAGPESFESLLERGQELEDSVLALLEVKLNDDVGTTVAISHNDASAHGSLTEEDRLTAVTGESVLSNVNEHRSIKRHKHGHKPKKADQATNGCHGGAQEDANKRTHEHSHHKHHGKQHRHGHKKGGRTHDAAAHSKAHEDSHHQHHGKQHRHGHKKGGRTHDTAAHSKAYSIRQIVKLCWFYLIVFCSKIIFMRKQPLKISQL